MTNTAENFDLSDQNICDSEEASTTTDQIDLVSLAKLTGFPSEFIKQELLIDDASISMDSLRSSMLNYLESTFKDVKIS